MKLYNCYVADFETTTDENDCRVWAYSVCNIDEPSHFDWGTSIDEFFEWIESNKRQNYKIWFHNLKFDGIYILNYLFLNGYTHISDKKERADKTFTTLITDMGQFYSIVVYFTVKGRKTHKVEFFDSLKIFPNFSVERIAEGFNLPIRKLSIDYDKYRPVGCQLTAQEIDYIKNDVEIVARALKEMFSRGLTKMTIASDAMSNFKDHFVGFRKKFPILPDEVDKEIRKSYRGGFTYVNDVWKEKEVEKGITLDINSLYPSCMSTPYLLPYNHPKLYEGEYQQDDEYPLYVQSLICSFEIKPHKIPCIQIRNTPSFMNNEYVKSSNGKEIELVLTKPDLELFLEQYNVYNLTYIGGWKFKGATGLFDEYINYWTEQKIKAGKEGNKPLRQISKLMLNSLYGRLAISSEAKQKIPYFEDGVVKFFNSEKEKRETVYVPAAAFITAYGRNRTIRTCQTISDYTRKKYGKDLWYYADTDSAHADLSDEDLEELKDIIQIDDFKLGCWKKEATFGRAFYIRAKCYAEMVDGEINVVVAGLPKYLAPLINFENFKRGFTTEGMSLNDMVNLAKSNGASQEKLEKIQHKLTYKYVKGGVILADTDFTII